MKLSQSGGGCPILETILNADPPNTPLELQKQYQTLVLHSIVDYLQTGNEDILVLFKGTNPIVADQLWSIVPPSSPFPTLHASQTLELTNSKTFQDFSILMGAQTKPRLAQFVERYRYFEDPTGGNTCSNWE